MAEAKYEPRLKAEYVSRIRGALKEEFSFANEMMIPKLEKIVINMGVGEATADSKKPTVAAADLAAISGQKAVITKARNSIAGFKVREGMPIGAKVTLRGARMYRSEEHTSELQSLMRISYAVFCLQKKTKYN